MLLPFHRLEPQMTIGWWVFMFGVVMVLFEAPGRSAAVIAVGILPFIIVWLGWWRTIAGLACLCVYLVAVAGTISLLLPLNGDAANLLLLFFLAMVMLMSWPTAFDTF